jgi:hypothetical protein
MNKSISLNTHNIILLGLFQGKDPLKIWLEAIRNKSILKKARKANEANRGPGSSKQEKPSVECKKE